MARQSPFTACFRSTTSTEKETFSFVLQIIGQCFKNKGLSAKATNILLSSWRPSTKAQYGGHITKWMLFCSKRDKDPLQTTAGEVVEFLTELSTTVGYSTLNTARAALSSLVTFSDGYTVGSHPLISRFFKGVFQLNPPTPRYSSIWDANILLTHLKTMSPAKNLCLKDLTLKTAMLMAMVSAQRQQTLHLFNIVDMNVDHKKYVFYVNSHLKHTRPSNFGTAVTFRAYPPDRRLCVHTYITEYLKRTKICRKRRNHFLSVLRNRMAE